MDGIVSYILEITNSGPCEESNQTMLLDASQSSIRVTGLEEASFYIFELSTLNGAGRSTESLDVSITTDATSK